MRITPYRDIIRGENDGALSCMPCHKCKHLLVPDDKILTLLKLRVLNVLNKLGPAAMNFEFRTRRSLAETSLSVMARQYDSKS